MHILPLATYSSDLYSNTGVVISETVLTSDVLMKSMISIPGGQAMRAVLGADTSCFPDHSFSIIKVGLNTISYPLSIFIVVV